VNFNARPIQRISQTAAWVLAAVIVFLSLGPPPTRPITGAGHNFEHLFIFLVTGAAFGLGYPRRFAFLPIALAAFAAAIEVAQVFIAGRHARLSDFLTDGTAACLGIGLSYVLVKLTAAAIES
jgi:VanZ family protein